MSSPEHMMLFDNPRNKVRGSYVQGWRGTDKVMLFVSFAIIALAFTLSYKNYMSNWLLIAIVPLALLPNAHIEYAKFYSELNSLKLGAYIALILRDKLWVCDEEDRSGFLVKFLRRKGYIHDPDRRVPMPLRLEVVEAGKERYGVLSQTDGSAGHMFLVADGSRYGELDATEKESVHRALSRAVNTFFGTADDSRKVGVTPLRVTRPQDLTHIDTYMRSNADPFMVTPERFDLDEKRRRWVNFRHENFGFLKPMARSFGASQNWMVFVITFQWTNQEWKKARAGKYTHEQISDLPLIELSRTLHEEIAAIEGLELQNPRVMGPAELALFVRSTLDVYGDIDDYYLRRAAGLIPRTDDEVVVVTEEMVRDQPELYSASDINLVVSDLEMWPHSRIIVKNDRILIDDTWFMVLRVVETPEQEHLDLAQRVHLTTPNGIWDSYGDVSERTIGVIDTQVSMISETAKRGLENYLDKGKVVKNPRFRRRQNRADAHIEQISFESTNQRFHKIIVIAAPRDNLRQLQKNLKRMRLVLKSQGMRCRPVKGRARQMDALVTGLFGANRL